MDNIWTYRVIYPGFTVVGLIVLFIFTPKLKERIIVAKRPVEYVSLMDSLREVAKNKYFKLTLPKNVHRLKRTQRIYKRCFSLSQNYKTI